MENFFEHERQQNIFEVPHHHVYICSSSRKWCNSELLALSSNEEEEEEDVYNSLKVLSNLSESPDILQMLKTYQNNLTRYHPANCKWLVTTYFMVILANASDSGSTPCSRHCNSYIWSPNPRDHPLHFLAYQASTWNNEIEPKVYINGGWWQLALLRRREC